MEEKSTAYNILMDVIIAVGVAVQIYTVIDILTDGRLTSDLSTRTVKLRARIKEAYRREREVRKNTGAVIFDAITTVEDAGNTGGDAEGT